MFLTVPIYTFSVGLRYMNKSLVVGTPWKFQGTAKLRYRIVFDIVLDERNNTIYCSL